ncbi:MAG TPA: MFS transporter [Anaerolineales bacterium]
MLRRLLYPPSIPQEYQANFLHLYLDIGWFGVLSGSAINFLNIYAARLGASGLQIGLLAAVSAVVNLLFAIPAGRWLEKHSVGKAVFWTSVYYRIGFALWIPLPWLFGNQAQVWALIVIALLMGIPLTALAVGFNALFAAAVPNEWRAHVAGIRNMVLSVAFILTALISGYILNHYPFPLGYQIVFAIGFIGAAMSSLHLYFVRPLAKDWPASTAAAPSKRATQSPRARHAIPPARSWRGSLRLDIWKTHYRRHLLVLFGFHLTQFLAIPLFSLYMVRVLHLTDNHIGVGTALFYLTVLLGSSRLTNLVGRLGHKAVTGWGVIGMGLYPLIMATSVSVWQYYLISILGGLMWAFVGGAYANYLLEHTPDGDRPSHLAWYNVVLNAAVLIGSLAGPALGSSIGLAPALMLFGVLRIVAGVAILKWG